MKTKTKWELPHILIPELNYMEKRINKACDWVEANREDIHPDISFINAVQLYDFGINVTQIKSSRGI